MTSRTHTPKDVQKIIEPWRDSASDYERGFIDGMMYQTQTSVYKAVDAMSKRTWIGLTAKERSELWWKTDMSKMPEHDYGKAIEAKLKEKNDG